jgi:hypothetical protein
MGTDFYELFQFVQDQVGQPTSIHIFPRGIHTISIRLQIENDLQTQLERYISTTEIDFARIGAIKKVVEVMCFEIKNYIDRKETGDN